MAHNSDDHKPSTRGKNSSSAKSKQPRRNTKSETNIYQEEMKLNSTSSDESDNNAAGDLQRALELSMNGDEGRALKKEEEDLEAALELSMSEPLVKFSVVSTSKKEYRSSYRDQDSDLQEALRRSLLEMEQEGVDDDQNPIMMGEKEKIRPSSSISNNDTSESFHSCKTDYESNALMNKSSHEAQEENVSENQDFNKQISDKGSGETKYVEHKAANYVIKNVSVEQDKTEMTNLDSTKDSKKNSKRKYGKVGEDTASEVENDLLAIEDDNSSLDSITGNDCKEKVTTNICEEVTKTAFEVENDLLDIEKESSYDVDCKDKLKKNICVEDTKTAIEVENDLLDIEKESSSDEDCKDKVKKNIHKEQIQTAVDYLLSIENGSLSDEGDDLPLVIKTDKDFKDKVVSIENGSLSDEGDDLPLVIKTDKDFKDKVVNICEQGSTTKVENDILAIEKESSSDEDNSKSHLAISHKINQTINISEDEFDSMCLDQERVPSLKSRLSGTITIESDGESPLPGTSDKSIVFLDSDMSDTDNEEYIPSGNDSDCRVCSPSIPSMSRTTTRSAVVDMTEDNTRQANLTTEQVTDRMRNVFESGLAVHFTGEEMEGCRAVSTPLYSHQRIALAWMCRHENEPNDGMSGGILADDMGLGKTLTVIALILTNHWDGKPLAKPELGFTRKPLTGWGKSKRSRGKGKVGGAFKPKVSADSLGVGKKTKSLVKKKTSIAGLFDKFRSDESSDEDSEKDNRFTFNSKSSKKEMKDFIVGTSEEDKETSDDNLNFSSGDDDDFDKMTKRTSLSAKLNHSKSSDEESNVDLDKLLSKGKTEEKEDRTNPADMTFSDDEDFNNMSQEDKDKMMIPTSLDGVCDQPEFDLKLNVDGFLDDSDSDDAINKSKSKKEKNALLSDTDDESLGEPSKKKKRNSNALKRGLSISPEHRRFFKKSRNDDDLSDASLPDVDQTDDGERNTRETNIQKLNSVTVTRSNDETGVKLIIPPKEVSVRGNRRRPTLLVCPTSLISHWIEQLENHLHKSVDLKVLVHHGSSKTQLATELNSQDVVITTYGTLAAEFGSGGIGPLARAHWLRVVLDEGHYIKNHNTKAAKAAQSLNTHRRWIVTGTPIQNNLMELWSLVNWLNFGIYAGKSQMRVFKQHIDRPCKRGDMRGFDRLQVLIDAICLRRTKLDKKPDGSPLVSLPRKKVVTREVVLGEEERLCYAMYHKMAAEIVGRYQRRGELLRNYAHVFALMMRLRQLCCHRELIKEVDWAQALSNKEELSRQLEEYLAKDQDEGGAGESTPGVQSDLDRRLINQLREMIRSGVSEDCSVCLDDLLNPVITPCAHVYCRSCIERVLDTVKPPNCPLCRNKMTKKELLEAGQDDEIQNDKETDSTLAAMEDIVVTVSSSKVNAALKEILRIRRDMPDDKVVIVSQFTSFISILQPLLVENNFSYVRLDGSMPIFARSETVDMFQSSKKNSPKVLLLSLKAGGVGLNLTAANHLLLLDPAWNPASEWQCFDRIHRLGQVKDVNIYKFITKDSVEEKMVEIQSKKEQLISGAFTIPTAERRHQRVQDIRNIFGI